MAKALLAVLISAALSLPAAARQNAPAPPLRTTILFVGSSIFHRWTNLTSQMSPLPVVNRAFDGAQTSDMLVTFDSVVASYRPRVIVYYCGSNDVDAGDPPDTIVDRIRQFVARAHTAFPQTRVVFVSIIRAPEKKDRWDVVDAVNRHVQALVTTTPGLEFVDVNPIFFSRDGAARIELYLSDGLHLRAPAYEEFARVLKPVLKKALQ